MTTRIVGTDLTELQRFTQDSIQNLLKQNQTFCESVGELAGIGTEFAIETIPQLKILNKPVIRHFVSDFAESQATKLCQKIQDGWNTGKYCSTPLTSAQKVA